MTAFFEWRAIPLQKNKQKLRIISPEGYQLAIADLWEHGQHPVSGIPVESLALITTSANPPPKRINMACRLRFLSYLSRYTGNKNSID